jgi:hypothetical protein
MPGKSNLILIIALWVGIYKPAAAQYDVKDSAIRGVLIDASYAAQLPGGDLAKVFGFNSNIQLGVYYKTSTNWIFGAQGAYIFGNVLRDKGLLDSIATSDGNLISNDGTYPSITYFERGYDIQLSVGKLIPFKKPNPNSGLLVSLNVGYIRHKIRIQDNNWTPQIDSNYTQGYEHLAEGIAITEFVGYQYLSNIRTVNFFAGFEFTQAFTWNLQYDFARREFDTSTMHDLLSSIRVGWILPLYKQAANKYYTY